MTLTATRTVCVVGPMRLFHFSDDAPITRFEPRAVRVASQRAPGREWLNGPLVWAIDDAHQAMYLFPRDCPRILLWPTARTTAADRALWFSDPAPRMIAYIEAAWLGALNATTLYRYDMPTAAFECLGDAGMWVSRAPVEPLGVEPVRDLPRMLRDCEVELRVMETLGPLRNVWSTSLHASGIRLRNAVGWADGEPV